MPDEKNLRRRDVLKSAAVGGLSVAAASAALKANAREVPAVIPPGRDVRADTIFSLEFEETNLGFFTECSGIGSETEVVEHKVVDQSGQEIVRKIPGRLKWTDITLKRGLTSDLAIWEWRDLVVQGKISEARGFVSITQYAQDGSPMARWKFNNAWPSKVMAGSEHVPSDGIPDCDTTVEGIEEVTIVVEDMYRET